MVYLSFIDILGVIANFETKLKINLKMLKSTINRMISTSKLTNNVNFALKQQRTFIQSTNNKSNQTKLLQQTKNQTLEKLQNVNNNMNQTSLKNGKSLLPLIGVCFNFLIFYF